MENEKRKRGRPPKIFTAETTGMTYEGTKKIKVADVKERGRS